MIQLMNPYIKCTSIAGKVVINPEKNPHSSLNKTHWINFNKQVDLGFPIMFLILAGVFWITIDGANVPSGKIANPCSLIRYIHPLNNLSRNYTLPWWISGVLIDGAYLAMAWVISVMLPPMAIFFPVYTLLEDFGYLPRVAFNMDPLYKKVGAHGKQALTMTYGIWVQCCRYSCNKNYRLSA